MSSDASIAAEALSPKEFTQLSSLSLSTVRRYVRDGVLPSLQPGGRRCRVLIPRAALAQFAPKLQTKAEAPQPVLAASSSGKPQFNELPGPRPRWQNFQERSTQCPENENTK